MCSEADLYSLIVEITQFAFIYLLFQIDTRILFSLYIIVLFQTTTEFKELVNLLIFTIRTQSPELAFHAAVSLGRLCVVEPVSRSYLISRLPGLSPHEKGEVGPSYC